MYIDFMGTDAAIFRTLGKQTAMRTDQYNSQWLNGEGSLQDPGWAAHLGWGKIFKRHSWGIWPCDCLGWGRAGAIPVLVLGFCWGKRPCWRSTCPADHCLPTDPSFIHAELIPDSAERNDDKLYFFFRERSAEAPQSPAVYARIGRICLVCAGRAPSPRLPTQCQLKQPYSSRG